MVVLLYFSPRVYSQATAIDLEKAFEISTNHYPALKKDLKFIEQQEILINAAADQPLTEVYLAGQQIDPNSSRGINGVGFNQDFNWPGTRKRRTAAQQQNVLLGNAKLEVTQFQLKQEVAKAYFEILFTKDYIVQARAAAALMAELVELAELRMELGETGKIPVLSAMGKEKQAILKLQQARHDNEIAHTIFNNWLYSDTLYTVVEEGLPPASGYINWFVNGGHPELLYQQQQISLATSQVITEKSWLLPQITMGSEVQMIDADLPFYGYRLGMKMPLGQKAARARIAGAMVEKEIQETELDATRVRLENERLEVMTALKKEQETLDFLQKELLPLAEEQIESSRKAYSQGAVTYQDYLQNIEQALESQWQYLFALRRYHMLRLELEFLSGRK
jgi:outer membrane protein TolC